MKSILIAGTIFLSTITAIAQEKEPSIEQEAKAQTEQIASQLKLTDEQKSKVYTLNEGLAQKNQAIKNNPKMTDEQKKEILAKNEQARLHHLKNILTEEQYKKYTQSLKVKKTVK